MKLKQILAALLASPFAILILNNPAKALNLVYRSIPTMGAFYDAGINKEGYLYIDYLKEIDNPRQDSEFWNVLTSSYKNYGDFISSNQPISGNLYIDEYRVCPPGSICSREWGSVGAQLNLTYEPDLNQPKQPNPIDGNLRWIQLVKSNHSVIGNHGDLETVIDRDINRPENTSPYYDSFSKKQDFYSFSDTPSRPDIDKNHDWKALLFLAEEIPREPGTARRQIKIYGGVKWGWHNRVTEERPDTPVEKPRTREQRRQEQEKQPQRNYCPVSTYGCDDNDPPSNGGSGGGGFNKYDPNYRYTTIPESTPVIGVITLGAWAIVKTLKLRKKK